MQVVALDHINIRTTNVARTIAFFQDVLSMRVGPSPISTSTEQGAWVFDATGKAIVHLADAKLAYPSDGTIPFKPSTGSGALHHVALRCSGFDETLARVQAGGFQYHENNMPERKLRQLFVRDPNDILFELNFSGDLL